MVSSSRTRSLTRKSRNGGPPDLASPSGAKGTLPRCSPDQSLGCETRRATQRVGLAQGGTLPAGHLRPVKGRFSKNRMVCSVMIFVIRIGRFWCAVEQGRKAGPPAPVDECGDLLGVVRRVKIRLKLSFGRPSPDFSCVASVPLHWRRPSSCPPRRTRLATSESAASIMNPAMPFTCDDQPRSSRLQIVMGHAILIETPFASATQTARILGVSKSRKQQLAKMLNTQKNRSKETSLGAATDSNNKGEAARGTKWQVRSKFAGKSGKVKAKRRLSSKGHASKRTRS